MIVEQLNSAVASNIRYTEPFNHLESSKPEIHALIHFLFLNFAMNDRILATNEVILQFKQVCHHLETHQWAPKEAMRNSIEEKDNSTGDHARPNDQHMLNMESGGMRMTSELVMSTNNSHTRTKTASDQAPSCKYLKSTLNKGTDISGSGQSRVPSILVRHSPIGNTEAQAKPSKDQVKSFEDQLRAELAEDKAYLEVEILALKEQLDESKR